LGYEMWGIGHDYVVSIMIRILITHSITLDSLPIADRQGNLYK